MKELNGALSEDQRRLLNRYLNCLQACFPKERLYNLMAVNSPSEINSELISEDILIEEIAYYKDKGRSKDFVKKALLSDEYYMNSEQLIEKYLAVAYD